MRTRESNIPLISSLYRATGACADHHDQSTVRLMHIETAVDEFLRKRAGTGGVVFITGNPGDGKTHLLRRLEADLRASKMDVVLDANEASNNELIDKIDAALLRKGRGLAVAINEGVLIQVLREAKGRKWAAAASDFLLHPFVLHAHTEPTDASVTVLDLNLRNNLSPSVIRKAIDVLIGLSAPCAECSGDCSLQRNVAALSGDALDRLIALLEAVSRTGFHATMRDLEGALSYLLFGDCDCLAFQQGEVSPYWINAFEGGQGPLFDALRSVDPQRRTFPLLDDQLWRAVDSHTDWISGGAPVERTEMTLEERKVRFVNRKRRALFEHRQGVQILSSGGTAVDRVMSELLSNSGRRSVTAIIRLLNRFFDRSDSRSDALHLWVTHRFDAQASRFAAASQSVGATEFEILVPKLRPHLSEAFPKFQAQHVILGLRAQDPTKGLRIDRPLVEALVAAEQGMPSTFRRGEPEARIAAFFDRVSKLRPQVDDLLEVRVVDTDTGASIRVGIDVTARSYARP